MGSTMFSRPLLLKISSSATDKMFPLSKKKILYDVVKGYFSYLSKTNLKPMKPANIYRLKKCAARNNSYIAHMASRAELSCTAS